MPKNQQFQALEAQLELAARIGLPVIIHSRQSNDDIAVILESWVTGSSFRQSKLAQRKYVGVLHAYSGDAELAQQAYSWNFVLSLGGPVTFKNARDLHQLVPSLCLDRLMLETDAPYLTPHPYRGKRNEPHYVKSVCEALATLYQLPPLEVASRTHQVACDFYGLDNLVAAKADSHAECHV